MKFEDNLTANTGKQLAVERTCKAVVVLCIFMCITVELYIAVCMQCNDVMRMM